MRTFWPFLLVPLIAGAQFPPPRLTGVLLERDAGVASGEFAVRAADNQVYRYRFDARTAVERDDLAIDAGRLIPGEKVEVESEAVAGSLLRYARTVHVVATVVPQHPVADARARSRAAAPLLPQAGNLTFAGVVSRLNAQRLVLRTRAGEQTILIRQDTHYVDNGDTVEAAALQTNMRVFVRAGKNLYEQVEAYQVIWGKILEPKRP
jgi:hypothetical protein